MSADYFSVADEEFVFELVVDFLRSKKLAKAVEILQQEYSSKKAPIFGKQEQPTRLEVLVSEGLIAMSPIDATRAQKMDVWDSIPAQKRSHPHLQPEQPTFAAKLTAVPEEEELSAITPRSAQSEAGYLTHRATRTFSWSGPLIDVKKLTRKSGSTISPSSYGRSPRTSSLLEETRPPLQHSPRTGNQLTRHSSVRLTRSQTNPNSPKSPNSASMPKGAKAQNNFATTSMPSLPVVPLYPPSSTQSNSSPAITAPPIPALGTNIATMPVHTPAPALPPIITTKTISNPGSVTSGPTTPNNIPPIPSFALPDKSLPIAALKNPSIVKVIQSGSVGSSSDHPSSQSAVSSQHSVASPSLASHPSTSSSDTVKPIKENSYVHSVDPRLIDSVRSDDDDDSEDDYTTSDDDESSSDSDEYSDDDDQGYLRVPVKDNWDELQSTLSEVSDSDDDEPEVSILSSQVLKQTKEDFDSDDSDDEASLNNSKGSSGKMKKSQTKKPHERNPSMGGGVFEMELCDSSKKGIQYKLKSGDEEADFSTVNVVETTGGRHEYFNLKCIYVRGRTGFEESRDFPIRLHDVIAGRYEIIEYLGSAAFSRAVQCLDHMTGHMVCVKIIKNNKDFLDQSMDEIKLLKYIKANGDTEENHVIKMLDYFYYKEHLFIVCELLRENLYEFYKYNRESGEEIYFTLPRIQKVARQILIALKYIHSLGLIHCDLKPENVLMRSFSRYDPRCEVKVIDFGSSCFLTDHLSTYVQSRSYRAPEVILGMPYDQRIDIWSLGCILAELYTGKVLFQNDSVQTLLARLVGIMGQLERSYLKRGKYSAKYFTKNFTVLYDKKNGVVEYLYPKKSSLRRRLKTDDALFLDFMTRLLKVNARERPTAEEALEHPFLKFDFEKFPQGTKLTS